MTKKLSTYILIVAFCRKEVNESFMDNCCVFISLLWHKVMDFNKRHFAPDRRKKRTEKVLSGQAEGLAVIAGMKGYSFHIEQFLIHNQAHILCLVKQQTHGADRTGMHLHDLHQLFIIGKAQPGGTHLLRDIRRTESRLRANDAQIKILG